MHSCRSNSFRDRFFMWANPARMKNSRGGTMRTRLAIHLVALLLILTCCKTPGPSVGPTTANDEGMDKSVQPGDDFYAYANGGWLKNTEIPPDKSSYGIFETLTDESRRRTASLIQESANSAANASAEAKKVGDFYSSYMDD